MGKCNKTVAVLLDTVSIQKYIFSGRKLREFVGASYLVNWIYREPLKKTLELIFNKNNIDLYHWAKSPASIQVKGCADWEVGYIGGGNALLFFKNRDDAENFVKAWTCLLLKECPGLVPSIGVIEDFDFTNYTKSLRTLFVKLDKNKRSCGVNVYIPRHGISAECGYSGLAKEIYSSAPGIEDYVSSVVKTKLNWSPEATKWLEDNLLTSSNKDYCFTTEIDELGQKKEEGNYIAVVHIDGNSTGKIFQDSPSLERTRRLSNFLAQMIIKAMEETVKETVNNINNISNILDLKNKNNKVVLPLRPIIIGGDDITFVSAGKLGIWLAEEFIKNYKKLTENNEFNNRLFSCCAGVLITKTHMPFYWAYQLSEDLCRSAKKRRREINDDGNWLDFHIAYGGFSGSTEEIRKKCYRAPNGTLTLRPFKLDDCSRSLEKYSFKEMKKGIKEINESLSKSKILELREVLSLASPAADIFVKNLEIRGHQLPSYPGGDFHKKLWVNDETPYFDMIELSEFYPDFAL